MKGKILVTGASGFVGSHFVETAFKAGYEIHAAVRYSSSLDAIRPFVAKFVYLDFEDICGLTSFFAEENYTYIVHAAALTKAKTVEQMHAVNVRVSSNLIEAAFQIAVPPKRFVFISSLAAIGPVQYDDMPLTENNVYNPITIYGKSKQAAEEMIRQRFSDQPITIIRPTAVYGPREKDLFILFDTMNKGIDAYIGKAPQKLSFIYVKDLANLLLNACLVSTDHVETFNATDGKVYSRYEMANIFKQVLSRKLVRLHLPYKMVKMLAQLCGWLYRNSKQTPVLYPERLGELTAQSWACDITKAKTILRFDPAYDLEAGLSESLRWYKDNNWLK
ncbi:MAG: NAD-dependent epimerase/dehydratase family protein [Sphingobacterium sp.]|uniref:NAD-dependent epimerase/dehydratase family protein n=1 Tax=Sphingobacterium sp. JB170 TaxID=1434842 RepID=UPI00097EAAA9|nr:NAD(P)-dependent oxidoreductase [Sphingobacterium sp. JB170]SJN43336.1 NAD-dependent epimerase/dehydratase family protein [Sphingobacterium sp. JB170]